MPGELGEPEKLPAIPDKEVQRGGTAERLLEGTVNFVPS